MTPLWLTLDAVCCLIAAGGVYVWQTWSDDSWRETRWH